MAASHVANEAKIDNPINAPGRRPPAAEDAPVEERGCTACCGSDIAAAAEAAKLRDDPLWLPRLHWLGHQYDEAQEEHPPVTRRELKAWYFYDTGSSAVSGVVVTGFWPLLVQTAALAYANFPAVCPNVVSGNTDLANAVFNGTSAALEEADDNDGMFYYLRDVDGVDLAGDICVTPSSISAGAAAMLASAVDWISLNGSSLSPSAGYFCGGEPQTTEFCRQSNGHGQYLITVPFGLLDVNPSTFASAAISVSVILQVFVFITWGPWGDHTHWRRTILVVLTWVSCILTVLLAPFSTKDFWWLAGLIGVGVAVSYASIFVFYNGYIPELAALSELSDGVDPSEEAGKAKITANMDIVSNRGFYYGYLGTVIMQICVIPVAFVMSGSQAFGIMCSLAGVWWAGFAIYTFRHLKPRPGPEFPEGSHPLFFGWSKVFRTCGRAKQLPNLYYFLFCWFLYSDGFNVISNVGVLFASTEVIWRMDKTLGLTLMLLMSPLAGYLGGVLWEAAVKRWKLSAKQVVICCLVNHSLIPAYGILGLFSNTLGFKYEWELFICVFWYGFNLGAVQAYSRSLFATLTPPRLLSEFFSLYEITDRGSTWMGPLVVAGVAQVAPIRLSFIYILFMLLMPVLGLLFLDDKLGLTQAREFVHANDGKSEKSGLVQSPAASVGDDAQLPEPEDDAEAGLELPEVQPTD